MPPKRNNNPVMIAAIVLLGVALIALVVGLTRPTSTPAAQGEDVPYQNEGYTAPPPDSNPPQVVIPETEAEALDYLENNPLYDQTAPRPIRCELSTVNPATASDAELQTHFDQLTACLMKEWAPVLEAAGFIAVRPTVTIFKGTVQTACGIAKSQNASYCSGDQQVYFARDVLDVLPPRVAAGRLTVDAILAHEFGHAIQARTGILISSHVLEAQSSKSQALELSRRAELQADCFLGIYIGAVAQSLQVTEDDDEVIRALLKALGDDELTGDPNIVGNHGRGPSRVYWGELGIKTNPSLVGTCNTWVAPEDQVR